MTPDFFVKDSHFSTTESQHYHLLIEYYDTILLSAVYDELSSTVVAAEYHSCSDTDSIVSTNLIQQDMAYKSVCVSLTKALPSLIPNAFFDADELNTIQSLAFSSFSKDSHQNIIEKIKLLNVVFVFSEQHDTLNAIKQRLPFQSIKITHSAPAFLNASYQYLHKQDNESQICFLSIKQQRAYIAVIDNDQLRYFQFFDFQTIDDLTYFLLSIYDKLKLDTQQYPLLFNGNPLEEMQEIEQTLKSFFAKVDQFIFFPSYLSLSLALKSISSPLIVDLINSFPCES